MRNIILICVRLKRILNDVLLYGTSEKLLDINRGINKVRDVMIPDHGSTFKLNLSNPNGNNSMKL